MKHKLPMLLASLLALTTLGVAQDQPSAKAQERVIKEVRHELLMLPYFGVFDYIAFKVDGANVTLVGQVVRPTLKSDAENSIKHIEGVEKVDNQIEVLPPSPMDDGIRRRLFRAIYAQAGTEVGMATTTGTSVSLSGGPQIPDQVKSIVPVLQAQDGSFVGTVEADSTQYMIAFDATGNVRWTAERTASDSNRRDRAVGTSARPS